MSDTGGAHNSTPPKAPLLTHNLLTEFRTKSLILTFVLEHTPFVVVDDIVALNNQTYWRY